MNREAINRNPDPSATNAALPTELAAADELSPPLASNAPRPSEQPLREAVDAAMRRYFDHLDGGTASDLYAMVMAEVEAPLLAAVMDYTQGNQTQAAEILGLNRGTLRKKLKHHDLI